jgi:hypothetical protein
MCQLSLGKHQVLEEGRNKFQRELKALNFSNVKIETLILELNDSRDEDVQKVFNLVLMSLQLSHQILPYLDIDIQKILNIIGSLKRLAFVNFIKHKLQHINYDTISKKTM